MAVSTLNVIGSVAEMCEERSSKEKQEVKSALSSNVLVWLRHDLGDYLELKHERHFFYASCRSSLFVCHFYTIPSEDCEIMDYHLKKLASKHVETKFCRLDIANAPFFKKRLSISVFPFLVMVRRKKIKDYISGFSQLGNRNDVSTDYLEWRLAKSKMIRYNGDLAVPPQIRTDSPKLLRSGNVMELQKCKKTKSRDSFAYERRRKSTATLTSVATGSMLVKYGGAVSVRVINEKRNLVDDDFGVVLARGTALSPIEKRSSVKCAEVPNKKHSVDVIWVSTKPVTSKTSLSSNKSKISRISKINAVAIQSKQNQNQNQKLTANEKLIENSKNAPKLLYKDQMENVGIEEASAVLIKLQQEKLQLRKSFMPNLNGKVGFKPKTEKQNDIERTSKKCFKILSDKPNENKEINFTNENLGVKKKIVVKRFIKKNQFEIGKKVSLGAIEVKTSNPLPKPISENRIKMTSKNRNLSAINALHVVNKYPESQVANKICVEPKTKRISKKYKVYKYQDENNSEENGQKLIDTLNLQNIENMTVGTIINLSACKIDNSKRL